MKILILHNDLRVYWKGRLNYLRRFLAGHQVSLYAIEIFGQGSPYAFDPYDNAEHWWTCLFPDKSYEQLTKRTIIKTLKRQLDEINPDIIIAGSIVFFSGALGLRWAKNNNKKFIMFDDGKPSHIKRNFFVRYVKNLITKQADALWLPSHDYDYEYDGLFDKETVVFHGYNTIDNQLFKFKEKKTFDHNIIITIGRLVGIKNYANLLRAWKQVEEKNGCYKLAIIGDGPEHENLTRLTKDLGLKRVIFEGVIANSKLPEYLYNADAFILTSYAESWGMVVNEAMAAGLPVLLSNKINANNALLKEGENGYSFTPQDVNEMAAKILAFIKLSPSLKQAMSEKSLAIIDTMSYENMGNELLNAVNKIMSQPVSSPPFIASAIINLWPGNYNTAGWNKA